MFTRLSLLLSTSADELPTPLPPFDRRLRNGHFQRKSMKPREEEGSRSASRFLELLGFTGNGQRLLFAGDDAGVTIRPDG